MTDLLPELRSVCLRETDSELVVEVEVPAGLELAQMTACLAGGVLRIALPRVGGAAGRVPCPGEELQVVSAASPPSP